MLTLDEVSVHFGPTVAVDRVSLQVPEGEVLAVLGPSGCGKSTLLRAVAGLEELDTGVVRAAGRDLAGVPTHRRGFALMFQDGQLFRHLDVAGNIGYPLRLRQLPRPQVRARVAELLQRVGLPGYGARDVSTLSGGEQQRVALARALAAEPRLLLLDEPLSALDRSLRERLAADLRAILTGTGTTALLVTHDHDEAFTLADRMALMFAGRIVQHGPTQQVWREPVSRQVAEFTGFSVFLHGAAADRVLQAAAEPHSGSEGADEAAHRLDQDGILALRRAALRVDPHGPLAGTVHSAAATTDAVRVELDVDEVGRVEALAGQDAVLEAGDRVQLRTDRTGMALLPADARPADARLPDTR